MSRPDSLPAAPVDHLARLIGRLYDRASGCPWCREQTPHSLRDDLIEEAYEAADAIDREDWADLADELGDLLALVVTQAELAAQAGHFDLAQVVQMAIDKTVRRNPHVFGDAQAATAAEVLRQWEALKRAEQPQQPSVLSGAPRSLPALVRAQSLQERAAHVGFDWPNTEGVLAKVEEELDELRKAGDASERLEEIGDALFSLVNLARAWGLSAEQALQAANEKFVRRFQAIEEACRQRGVRPEDLSLAELDALWEAAKQAEP